MRSTTPYTRALIRLARHILHTSEVLRTSTRNQFQVIRGEIRFSPLRGAFTTHVPRKEGTSTRWYAHQVGARTSPDHRLEPTLLVATSTHLSLVQRALRILFLARVAKKMSFFTNFTATHVLVLPTLSTQALGHFPLPCNLNSHVCNIPSRVFPLFSMCLSSTR